MERATPREFLMAAVEQNDKPAVKAFLTMLYAENCVLDMALHVVTARRLKFFRIAQLIEESSRNQPVEMSEYYGQQNSPPQLKVMPDDFEFKKQDVSTDPMIQRYNLLRRVVLPTTPVSKNQDAEKSIEDRLSAKLMNAIKLYFAPGAFDDDKAEAVRLLVETLQELLARGIRIDIDAHVAAVVDRKAATVMLPHFVDYRVKISTILRECVD